MEIIIIAILSFLTGSIPFGVLIAKSKGIDLRKVGSGNIGATNVLRAVGKTAALFTLIGDILKGSIPVLFSFFFNTGSFYAGLMGLIAIIGHDFSIFLKFRGGKGVATSLGVILVYSPYAGLLCVASWLLTAWFTRYSSLSAIIAFILLPPIIFITDYSAGKIIISAIIAFLILYKHKENIKRLFKGTETKIGQHA